MPTKAKRKQTKFSSRLKTSVFKFFVSMVAMVLLCSVAGLIFFYIEYCSNVVQPTNPLKQDYQELCKHLTSNHSSSLLNDTIFQTKCGNKEIIDYKPDEIICELNMENFGAVFDMSSSIGFTIGYGRVVPRSDAGRIFFIIIAMPLIAIVMTSYMFCGEIVTIITELIVDTTRTKCFNIKHTRHVRAQKFLVQLVLCLIFWFMSTSTHKMVYPNLTWLECFYYNMATVSTVGFGDYSFNSYEYLNAGLHYMLTCVSCFILSMGTVASVIGEVNTMVMEKTAKMESLTKAKRKHTTTKPKFQELKETNVIESNGAINNVEMKGRNNIYKDGGNRHIANLLI